MKFHHLRGFIYWAETERLEGTVFVLDCFFGLENQATSCVMNLGKSAKVQLQSSKSERKGEWNKEDEKQIKGES